MALALQSDNRAHAIAAGPSLRDRLLTSARFRSWAGRFPLTRFIARRRARGLFDLCAGFVYSQVLYACVQLRLFDVLATGPQSTGALANRLSLSNEATARLLTAAVSVRLASRRGKDAFGLGPLGAAMVGNPGIAAMIEHHRLLYADLEDPVALLRGIRPKSGLQQHWPYAGAARPYELDANQVAEYSALMTASQPLITEEVLRAYPLGRHRCVLDVGGGDGSFLAAAAARSPRLRLILFDLPAVADRAQALFRSSGLLDRAEVVGGSFLSDELPRGADIISLLRVIHDHDDDAALTVLRAARRALPPDGTVLLAEPMAGTPGAEPVGDAYFGFYLLAMGSGRPRSPAAIRQLLLTAGFDRIRLVATHLPILTRVLVARVSRAVSLT